MVYFFVSFGVWLHLMWWGLGLAMLVTPHRWAKYWVVWIAPAGVALQSVVVWVGAHTTLTGTDAYAWWVELLPVALLLWGWRRLGWWQAFRILPKFSGLWLVMVLVLTGLTLPLAYSSHLLTTTSIGSCDAADYAAGARVFKEFSSSDRTGFMGQTEVVRVGSTDNFFDFWLRLNHFTPSALIAFNATIFGLQAYQLTGVLTAVLVVLILPLVLWTARTMGLSGGASLWLALIYGLNPVTWYAVAHVAPAQLLAAMGITLVTMGALLTWHDRTRRGWASFGLLMIGFTIIWGGYNFIIVVCLVPAAACVGGWALARGNLRALGQWLVRIMVPLVLSGLFFYERLAGVAERFMLFQQTDFGWSISALWPEGWLGFVVGTGLEPVGGLPGLILTGGVLGLLLLGVSRIYRRSAAAGWRITAYLVPVMLGYGYLQFQGWHAGDHSSYDAYKLLAVFHPVLLVALCPWLLWLQRRGPLRGLAIMSMLLITLGNGYSGWLFGDRLSQGILVVEPTLPAIQAIEKMAHVDAVNLQVPNYWERLWANSFLLKKKQFVDAPTYEGRTVTDLRGDWDLSGGLVRVKLPGKDSMQINERFSLTRVASPWFLRARFGEGWHRRELWRARRTRHWRWSKPEGALVLNNPQQRPLLIELHLKARGAVNQRVEIRVDDRHLQNVQMVTDTQTVSTRPFLIAPGPSVIAFITPDPKAAGLESDQRLLGFALYAITVEVLPE
ncbi:MAG: hypothetical protein K9N01_04630 [Cephaloticoccus sp.]|nr:hypothetical protein [Cephaloticoccus sp.]